MFTEFDSFIISIGNPQQRFLPSNSVTSAPTASITVSKDVSLSGCPEKSSAVLGLTI